MLGFFILNRSRHAETRMQKFEQKGKAAAEAAAHPVMEESKMETLILYRNKMKPPGTNPAARP